MRYTHDESWSKCVICVIPDPSTASALLQHSGSRLPLDSNTAEPISRIMPSNFGAGPRRTHRPLVDTAQRVAPPPHRGLARETVTVVIDGRSEVLEVVRQDRINGGQQAYWCCGRCGALRSHLYVVDGTLLCRVCGSLDFRSRHTLHPALIRAAKLRRKLGAAPGLLSPLPRRPRRWRRDYWARAIAELVAAEASIAARLRATVEQVRRRSEHDRHRDRAA